MKTIIHIIFSLEIGGIENMLVDIANEQAKKNDVTLYILHNNIDQEVLSGLSSNVKIIFFGIKPPTKFPWFALKLWFFIHKQKPDIIHLHNESTLKLFPSIIKKILPGRTSYSFTIHTTGSVFGREIANADNIFAISNSVRNDVIKRIDCKNIKVVHNGVKCELFLQKSDFRKPKKFKLIQVGRLSHEIKGQDILLHSLFILKGILKDKEIELSFVGNGASAPFLRKLTSELGLEKDVIFLGAKDKKWLGDNLKNYDLLIQPSRVEGFGLTIVEGMAAKIPVLVSNIAGPMEVINNGNYGYYFISEDSHDCAGIIADIIEEYDTKKFLYKIHDGYEYVKQNFSIKDTAQKYIVCDKMNKQN